MISALLTAGLVSCGTSDETARTSDGAETPAVGSAGSGSNAVPAVPAEEWTEREQALLARLTPLPGPPPDPTNAVADEPRAAHYGRWLFFDARLSGSGDVSCATCHDPAHQFADPRALAVGAERGERHAPTLVEAAHQRWLGWGGRADSLWMQALGPLENPVEMAGDRAAIGALVRTDAELRRAHEAVFEAVPEDDTAVLVQIGKALAAYERLLVRGEGRFDRYAAAVLDLPDADAEALDEEEREGLHLFLGKARCTLCHLGPVFSDLEFHNNAVPPHPDGPRDDPGRFAGARRVKESPFNAAGRWSDDPEGPAASRVRALVVRSETFGEFRTPSLRNLRGREPFGHQGQFADLDAVLRFYDTLEGRDLRSHHQEQLLAPLGLTAEQRAALAAFLMALEGEPLDEALLTPPTSPVPG